jgi:hypothetical protein
VREEPFVCVLCVHHSFCTDLQCFRQFAQFFLLQLLLRLPAAASLLRARLRRRSLAFRWRARDSSLLKPAAFSVKQEKKNVCFFGLKQRFGQGSNVAAVVPVADALSLSCLANLTDLSCSSLPFWADLTHVQCAFVAPRCFEAAPSLSVLSRSCCLAWTNKTLDALSLQRVSSLSSAGFSALNATMLVRLVQKHGTKIGKRKDNMIVVVVVVLNKTIFSGIFVCWSTFYS